MASGASGEVVHCPNCNEDVPKTLYCLNCGFPLYKEEQPKEEKTESEVTPEPTEPAEEDAVIMVDEEETVEKPEEPKVEAEPETQTEIKVEEPEVKAEPETQTEIKVEEPVVEEVPAQPVEPVAQPEVKEPEAAPEPTPQTEAPEEEIPEPTPVADTPEPKPEEVAPPVVEAPPAQVEAPQPVSEPLSTGIEASKAEAVELVEDFQVETPYKVFAPDPLTKDLMDNLAKNISLKLKLVKLYRDGTIKEETFTKLFEGYSKEGKIWSSRRDEMLKKLAVEIEEMEDAFGEATEDLELLEVRRSIGEASEDEYAAKAPAYRWDIDHFDKIVGEKKNRVAYLENISNAMTDDELKGLRGLAGVQYNTLESLQVSKDEFLATIKDDLYEAIKILG